MACKYFYDNKEYTFDEFASLLENGLADEFLAKNLISSTGVYAKKAPVDTMPGAITINASNANVNVGKGSDTVTRIVRQSQRMVKAMSKLSPNLSFTIHATEQSWNDLREKMLADGTDITGMDGFYNPNTNEIHLNIPMMERLGRLNTAYHEGYHPLTNALFNARPDLRDAMHNQLTLMSEDQALPKEFRDQVKECLAFGNSYDVEKYGKESPLNEAIVEFLSRVSNGQIQIDGKNKTMMDHIRTFLNNLAGMFNVGVMMGRKEYTVDNLLDFARAMDFAIKQGVAVDFNPRNVPVFNSQDNLDLENGDVITSGYYPQTKAIQASFTPLDINWDYADLPENIQIVTPKNRETLADTLKKSGGAAVFINSDGTGVGVMSEDKYIDGGISYSFFKDNIDNEIGFAASEDSKISSFYKAVKHAAEVRDKTNPEFKGMPVAVYVTVQSAGSTIGNYHGAEFILDNIKEAIDKRKLNATELKKAFDYATKASVKARLVKSEGKETKAIKSYNKFLVDLKSIKSGDLVNELEKYLKKESFAFRLDILGNIIPNINVKSKTELSDFQNKLKELNIDLPSFYNKYLDKNILNSLEGKTLGKKFEDNGFAMTGFYVDPYMTDKEYVSKSKVDKFKHKQFNSAFHGTNPFILNGKYYVNNFFDEARFYSKKKKSFVPVSVSSAGSMYPRTWNAEDFNQIIERAEKSIIMPSLAGEFVDKLNETKESDPKQYWSVDTVSLEDAKEGTVIKTEAGYGFVSQSGDIKGVFKANKESAEKTGDEVLKKAVKAGGIKLDNFDGYLTKIYERNGFRIASRIPFNEEYAPEGWEKEAHGTPDVVAMVYDPYKQLDIEEKRFEDYMEGIDYRDSFVELAYGNAVTNEAMPPRIDPRPNDLVSASSIVYDMTEDGNGNYVFYTNTVTNGNADVDDNGMLNLSTNSKYLWEVSKEGKGDPTISSRNEIVRQAASDLKEGKITNEEYRAIAEENSPIGPITRFFEPATLEQMERALHSDKREDLNKPVGENDLVALRLDIPAYLNKNTWVVSVHDGTVEKGTIISYKNVAKIKNVKFSTNPYAALNIASGKIKNTIARMFGEWVPIEGSTVEEQGQNAKKEVENYVDNPNWVQVGMNPFRHSYFYDRSQNIGRPVLEADEVIQIGGLVYAKNVKYGNWTDEQFIVKKKTESFYDAAGKQIQFSKPLAVKVPFESTYPLDTNPLGLKPNIQPSIIGKIGAGRLDNLEKTVNSFKAAQRLESQGESKKVIKEATGWEKGYDNKWRRETDDFKYIGPSIDSIYDKVSRKSSGVKFNISDLVENNDLYKAYPEIKQIEIIVGKSGDRIPLGFQNYHYSIKDKNDSASYIQVGESIRDPKFIVINLDSFPKLFAKSGFLSSLEHEVQHFIQRYEGFSSGSNLSEAKDIFLSRTENYIYSSEKDSSGNLLPKSEKLQKELYNLNDIINSSLSSREEKSKAKDKKEKLILGYAVKELGIDTDLINSNIFQIYKRNPGEVEARNVEARRALDFESRVNTLFEETQDVKNEDFILSKEDEYTFGLLKKSADKSILQQAKNLGFAAVVNKDMEGNAVVMSDTVMPAKELGDTVYPNNKQKIQPSLGWAGSKGVQKIDIGSIGLDQQAPTSPTPGNVKVVSEKQQSAFFNNFRTFFSVTQGNSQAAKSLQESFIGEKSYVIEQIDKDAVEIKKLVDSFVKEEVAKGNGLSKETVYKFVNRAMIGEINPQTNRPYVDSLPQELAEAVNQARQNIVSLQETLVASGLLPAEIESVIASTIGSYTKASYYAFELTKPKSIFNIFTKQKKSPWFEAVPEKVRSQAKAVFQAWAMNGTLDNGFNIALNEYKKNFEKPYLDLLEQDELMQSTATQQAAMAMKNEKAKLEKKAGEFADAIMRKIEDVNQNGDVKFSIGGSVVSMKDYIEKNPALPKEIKEYLGEITDPAMNFRLTGMKLTRMLYNHQMCNQFKNLGLKTGDVVPPTEATPQGWIKLGEINQGESKTMKGAAMDETDALNKYGSLKGCSVTPAMYDLLFDKPIEGNLYYKFITSNIKKFKTIYSPSTQIKNLYGYTFFGMVSGAIPEGIAYAPTLASAAYKNISTPEGFMGYWNNMFNEAKKRGINTSLELEEINRIGKELSQNKELLAELKGSKSPATQIYQTFSSIFSTVEKMSKKGMLYGDAIPKTIMFEVFRNANAAVMNGTSFYELDAKQKELANEMASRRVKLTTVTDTRTIKGIDYLQRKMGIFGSFPRFMSESIRNFVNAHMLIVNPDMLHEGLQLSDNPTVDAELKDKLNNKTRATGFAGLAGYYSLMALIRAAMSFGDDDDEKVNVDETPNGLAELSQVMFKPKGTLTQSEALRRLLPEYDKFAALSYKIHKDGTVEYMNESSVDPFNIFPQAYRSYVYAENVGTGTLNAVKQVAMPILGWEILFGTALEVVNNENAKGNVVYKNFDSLPNQVKDVMAYAFRKSGPGIATSIMRYNDLVKSGAKEGTPLGVIEFATVEGVSGRISTTNIESKLRAKVKEINDNWIQDQRSYSSEFYRDKSPAERDRINKQRDENAKMYAYELSQLVESGYALGLSVNQVRNVFKDARVSKKVRKASMRGGSAIDKLNIDDIKED